MVSLFRKPVERAAAEWRPRWSDSSSYSGGVAGEGKTAAKSTSNHRKALALEERGGGGQDPGCRLQIVQIIAAEIGRETRICAFS